MSTILAVALVLAHGGGPSTERAAKTPKQSKAPYKVDATWISQSGGFETGLVAVATDPTTRCLDLVTASGNDGEAGPLALFANRTRHDLGDPFNEFIKSPDWHSTDIGFNTGLVAGRIDDDPIVDLVAIEFLGSPANLHGKVPKHYPGAIKWYRGVDCSDPAWAPRAECLNSRSARGVWNSFAAQPVQRLSGVYALSSALGDANGDGRLDIAVPIVSAGPGPVSLLEKAFVKPTKAATRIHLNVGGAAPVSPTASWQSTTETTGTSAAFADVNLDGLMDLVVGGDRLFVHFGRRNQHDRTIVEIDPVAEFVGAAPKPYADEWMVVTSLDVGWLQGSGEPRYGVVAGYGCPRIKYNGAPCNGGLAVYFPRSGGVDVEPAWQSKRRLSVSHVRLANVDGDAGNADNDIIFDTWAEPKKKPGRLRIARAKGRNQFDEDYFVSETTFVGEQIVARDLSAQSLVNRCDRFVFATKPAATLAPTKEDICATHTVVGSPRALTLSAINLHGITQVKISVPQTAIASPPVQTSWIAAEDSLVVSLSRDLPADAVVEVAYETSNVLDLAVATFDVSQGIAVFKRGVPRNLLYSDCLSKPRQHHRGGTKK